jgi:hypothetical protein
MIREVMQCKPGKVRNMVTKFKALNDVVQRLGFKPFRLFTDVSGVPFWTVVAEGEAQSLEDFLAMEDKVMGDADAQQAMAGYHDLVEQGRREVYRVES